MFVTGEPLTTAMIMQTLLPILYAGIMSSGVAYTLQVFGQAKVPPTEASLLLSMEMVFGALSGYLLLGETMNTRELLGCALMACGIFAAQVPSRILWQRQSEQVGK
jgi:drug/metabolite transporter (DMT)-like permease